MRKKNEYSIIILSKDVDILKEVLIIHNPNSGKKKNVYQALLKSKKLFDKYNYHVTYKETKYKGHAKQIMKSINNVDLVISVGGDGTFNEIVSGNIERKNPVVLSHIPVGTTNDLRSLFGLGKDIYKNISSILSGKEKQIDICLLNDQPFVYVAGFGKFINLSYETPRSKKSKFGYLAYLVEGFKDIFRKVHMYDLEFIIDGVKHSGKYSLGIISNANKIAGIKNFYKDVKLDDNTFEVLFCSISKRRKLLRSLVNLGLYDITKVNGVEMYRTNNIKIIFKDRLKQAWTFDGEKYRKKEKIYNISLNNKIKFRISSKACEKNCIK